MRLNNDTLKEKNYWLNLNYHLPEYDREEMIEKTKKAPNWIHFGAGNIFKAFQANIMQKLLNQGFVDKGIITAEGYDQEIITKISRPYDDLAILVTLKADGKVEKTIIGSITESLIVDTKLEDFERLKEIFSSESLQIVSFTITEKGYQLRGSDGKFLSDIARDIVNGPLDCISYMGKIASLLYERYKKGKLPVAMVSMDNCSHNGDKLATAIQTIITEWHKNKFVNDDFLTYIYDEKKVSFPWTMIDKITPRPDETVKSILHDDGLDNIDPIITAKKTYIAPFVNAEESEYLVIEDNFPNGRPPLEKEGIIFTDRETVDKVEKMKVCTCLNPLHTALAIFGCLLGYKKISDEMNDPLLVELIKKIGYKEGLPVVVDPKIINPKEFIDTVINIRFPNPFMPDTPQRIATDTSQKLAIRFGETVKAYMSDPDLDVRKLKYIPLVYAGWLRYLMGLDDDGNSFELSPDPLLDELLPTIKRLSLNNGENVLEIVHSILKNEIIFGFNLEDAGMIELIAKYLNELTDGKNAVRKTLEKYCK